MHAFIGWTTIGGIKPLNLHYQIRKDIVYYPMYQEVNAYTNPLDASYFDYYDNVNEFPGVTGIIIYKLNKKVGGRICVPKSINGKPVLAIRGSVYNTTTKAWGKTVEAGVSADFTDEVYTDDGKQLNGFQRNFDLEQIYFVGANDDTSQLRTFGKCAFMTMINLSYIDFPNTLTNVEERGFFQCSKLAFSNFNHISQLGSQAFAACNTYDYDEDTQTWSSNHVRNLTLNTDMYLAASCLNQSGWSNMNLGSQSYPCTTYYNNTVCAGNPDRYYYNPQTGDTAVQTLPRELGCIHFVLWSTVQSINDFPVTSTKIFSAADRNNYSSIISLEVYNP